METSSYLLNIDSSFREKEPKNILAGLSLNINNIILSKDSNIMKLKFNNDNLLKTGDKIILKNFSPRKELISQALYFIKNYDYVLIYFPEHNFNINFQKYYQPNKIEILDIDLDDFKISNIPVNSLISKHQIYLIEELTLPDYFLDNINLTFEELKTNFIAVKLLYQYISFNNFDIVPNLVEIQQTEIAGIPIGYFNTDFPVNFNQRQGNYLVSNHSLDGIEVILPIKSYKDKILSQNILIDKIISEYEGYPENNSYSIKLRKHLTNVKKIELISSEIPNNLNNVSSKNNKFYWQNLDDGKYIYSVEIPEGNYNIETLINTLQTKINLTQRQSTQIIKPFNIFEIEYNKGSQEIIFKSFREDSLSNAIFISTNIIDGEERNVLEIVHPDNNVEINDIITITNSTAISYVPSEIINTSHRVVSINKINNSYQVILPTFNQTEVRGTIGTDNVGLDVRSAYPRDGAGGEEIKIRSRNFSRLLFNKSDSIGSLLGFRDIGLENAITSFKSELSNKDEYANEDGFNLNVVGNERNNSSYFNLTSDLRYILLYINDYEEVITNTTASNCFAKILINSVDGNKLLGNNLEYMINTFVSYPVVFNNPISNLSNLQIKFTFPDGSPVNFGNIEHSFTLKITEEINREINESQIDSKIVNIYRDSKYIMKK